MRCSPQPHQGVVQLHPSPISSEMTVKPTSQQWPDRRQVAPPQETVRDPLSGCRQAFVGTFEVDRAT